jgi:outer membrane protein, heavy metal efflux system
MGWRGVFLLLLAVTFLGCASSPTEDRAHHGLAPSLHISSLSGEHDVAQAAYMAPLEPLPEGAHPLSFYVEAALSRNPEIQAADRRVAAQAEVVPQVTSLPDPILSDLNWPSDNQAPQTAAGRVTNSLFLAQQFPWFGKLRLRGEVAKLETRIALTQLAEKQLKVIEEVKLAYFDIYFDFRALQILDESARILQADFPKAGVGKSAKLDIVRAQVELEKIEFQRVGFWQRLRQAQANLAKALATTPQADLRVADIPELPVVRQQLDQLYEMGLIARPELQGRIHAVTQDERLVELARLNYFPDVMVGFAWSDVTRKDALSKTANGEDSLGIAVGINLPVWQSKLRAGVREAENRTLENQRRYEAARDDMFRLIRQLTVQALAEKEQAELLRNELVPKARQALNLAVEGYRASTVDPVRVVDNWLQFTNLTLELARLESSIGKTMASLERVVGQQLTPLR